MKVYFKCPGCGKATLKEKGKHCIRCGTLYCKDCVKYCKKHDKKLWLTVIP